MHRWRTVALAAAAPLLLLAINKLVFPRPFYIYGVDDSVFYYLSRAVEAGSSTGPLAHPAIPIVYLGAWLLKLVGSAPQDVPTFVNASHVVATLSTAAGMGFFAHLCLREAPLAVRLSALAVVVAWPPFLTASDYLGPDGFIAAVGLPTLALLWVAISDPSRRKRFMFWHGVMLGTALAFKLTFLPLVLACFIAWGHMHLSLRRSVLERSNVSSAILGFALSMMWFLPNLPWLPDVFWVAISVGRNTFSTEAQVLDVLAYVMQVAPLYVIAIFAIAALFLYSSLPAVRTEALAWPTRTKGLLGGTLLAFFSYEALTAGHQLTWEADPGIVFRYAYPVALGFPFVVLLIWERGRFPSVRWRSALRGAALAAAPLVVLVALLTHIYMRENRTHDEERTAEAVYARMDEIAGPDGRIAFFPEVGAVSGLPAFHLRGDDMGGGHFSSLLVEQLPRYTIFRLDDAQNVLHGDTLRSSGVLENARDRWHELFGVTAPDPPELIEGPRAEIALIAFPRDGEQGLSNGDVEDLKALLEESYGPLGEIRDNISGYEWVFLTTELADPR